MEEVYYRIKQARIASQISQEVMAEKLGINQTTYGKLERGETHATIERLTQISAILDIPVSDLIGSQHETIPQEPLKVKPFDTYFGGKEASGAYQKIINCIRPHKTFISLFLGNDAIIRHKKVSEITIGVDIDPVVITSWRKMNILGMYPIWDCGIDFLSKVRIQPGTVIYADPPYLVSSRKSKDKVYNFEMPEKDHIRFLEAVRTKEKECDFLISCYENELYKEYLKDWACIKFTVPTRRGKATEFLYMNYHNIDGRLHDYSFLGENFIERQRIKRKIDRWTEKLKALPVSEMRAIIEAIDRID